MLRVLFCLNCCGYTPRNHIRPGPAKVSVTKQVNGQDFESADLKPGLLAHDDKTELPVPRDIQTNNANHSETIAPFKAALPLGVAPEKVSEPGDQAKSVDEPTSNEKSELNLSPSTSRLSKDENLLKDELVSKPKLIGLRSQKIDSQNWTNPIPSQTSQTKIGDYARLEYSPVEDLDSVKSLAQSREILSKRTSRNERDLDEISRSRGLESRSISIASQLSTELEQRLTNMLETANSPTMQFDTIGLPIGLAQDNLVTETTRTSPDTNGAALTSASQDSLSGLSSGPNQTENKNGTFLSSSVPVKSEAALVGVTMEPNVERSDEYELAKERLESSLSMATTSSVSLINPTPTPSEMSGSSSMKKRKLLSAKGLLKRLKPVKKRKSRDGIE